MTQTSSPLTFTSELTYSIISAGRGVGVEEDGEGG
eukprot:CAMPEP_0118667910 /NCGR_PEP_ID=MMETSP0785-20121206/20051_1 /TAXON_ID=91992 /ORGANISM="Bolidomonas pacifica, Strain CCMP 1866" /LENGTH=34 /DNA_ID= /DNA_START= /DNA_END= /DNA_ORIENTATION=